MDNNLNATSGRNAEAKPQEHLSASEVEGFFDRNFDKINTNHDKFLSKEELKQSLLKNTFSAKDARIAEAIIPNIHGIELLSNDEWGTENNGITRKDVTAFAKNLRKDKSNDLAVKLETSMNADEHSKDKFIEIVDLYKQKIDQNRSGTISLAELNHYASTSEDGATPVAVAKLVANHFDDLNNLGSKFSKGSYKTILPKDGNLDAITDKDLSSLKDLLRPEEQFREKLWDIHRGNQESGNGVGRQGRLIQGNGDSTAGIVLGLAVEVIGSAISDDSRTMEGLTKDYQSRKQMIESWKHFKE